MTRNRRAAAQPGQGVDHAIAALAARQHGNVTRRQLLAIGLSDAAIRHRLAVGRLFSVHWGVYAVGRPPVVALEHAAAGVLACGGSAALSGLGALALWEVIELWPERLDIIITSGNRRPRGIAVHRCALRPPDITVRSSIRVTGCARALLDCAPQLSDRDLARAVNDARGGRLTSPGALSAVIARYPNHPGARRLKPFAATTGPPTESHFEDRFSALCTRYRLPAPRFGARVCGHKVDALFGPERLIVECDSWEFHQDRKAFVTDRARDADTLAAGYATLRITWERPDAQEAERIRTILSQRGYTE